VDRTARRNDTVARTVNPAVHAERREAFLDAAQALIQTKGYEQMSIQDVLDELGASRGAFYHYFDSKAALLEAVIHRMVDVVMATTEPILADSSLGAAEKFGTVFSTIQRWKNAQRDLLLALMRVWLSDENAIVREKLRRVTTERLTPVLAEIIRQGCRDGDFDTPSPDESARILVSIIQSAQEVAGDLYIARQANAVPLETVERRFAAYSTAYERILGATPGSLPLVDHQTIQIWFG
jgi:AcrR family transcriptional regulator